jgi:hypothetical protein
MDTNMEDVDRAPAELPPVPLEPASIPTLDGWIESLMNCKQLAEIDVQRLCEKVREALQLMSMPESLFVSALLAGGRPCHVPSRGCVPTSDIVWDSYR